MTIVRPIVISLLIATIAACGGAWARRGPTAVDDMPEVPALPEGDIELTFPEQIIPAASEKQICMFLEKTTEDRYFKALKAFQGKFGHHLILFKTSIPEEPGTVRDCTESGEMANLQPVLASVNFGMDTFPDGMALKVSAGTQMVLQMHYINTSSEDIRVRDTMHVSEVKVEDTDVLAGFFGVSDINFRVMPGETHELEFECSFPRDMKLLMIGPHMHEHGTSFLTQLGPDDDLEEIQRIDKWEAEMRDDPPIIEWTKQAPYEAKTGDLVRVTCNFDNTTDHPLTFPEEMCAAYGYFFPAVPGAEEWICAPGQ